MARSLSSRHADASHVRCAAFRAVAFIPGLDAALPLYVVQRAGLTVASAHGAACVRAGPCLPQARLRQLSDADSAGSKEAAQLQRSVADLQARLDKKEHVRRAHARTHMSARTHAHT